VNGEHVRAGRREVVDVAVRILDHEVHVERTRGDPRDRTHDRRTDGDVRDEPSITSTWITSASPRSTAAISRPSAVKSADRTDGASALSALVRLSAVVPSNGRLYRAPAGHSKLSTQLPELRSDSSQTSTKRPLRSRSKTCRSAKDEPVPLRLTVVTLRRTIRGGSLGAPRLGSSTSSTV
jgi:hypothetical protein